MDDRPPQVGVHQQDSLAFLSQRDRQVGHGSGFSLAQAGAGKQNGLHFPIHAGELDVCPHGSETLSQHGFGIDQAGELRQGQDRLLIGLRWKQLCRGSQHLLFVKPGDDAQDRNLQKLLDSLDRADGGVERFPREGQDDSQKDSHHGSHHHVQPIVRRVDWSSGSHGRRDDRHLFDLFRALDEELLMLDLQRRIEI